MEDGKWKIGRQEKIMSMIARRNKEKRKRQG